MANAPILVAEGDEEIEVDYDSDGFPIPSESAKVIDPLPPIDHSAVSKVNFVSKILHSQIFCYEQIITYTYIYTLIHIILSHLPYCFFPD